MNTELCGKQLEGRAIEGNEKKLLLLKNAAEICIRFHQN